MTTANMLLVAKNSVDHPACVLSCTATPTLPLDNLKNYTRERITRIPCNPAFEIRATFGGNGVYASAACLSRCNLEPAATWRFQGYTAATNWTGANVDTGTLTAIESATLGSLDWGVQPLGGGIFDPFYGQKMALAFFARTLFLSWKITITDTGNSHGAIDISRAIVGEYFQPAWNFDWGYRWGWKEKSEIWDTDGGGPRCDAAVPYRAGQFDIKNITEAERQTWMSIFRTVGVGRSDFLVCPFPTGTSQQIRDYSANAIFTELPDITGASLSNNQTTISLREV